MEQYSEERSIDDDLRWRMMSSLGKPIDARTVPLQTIEMPPRRAAATKQEFEGPNEEEWWQSDGEGGSDSDMQSREADGLHDPDKDERDAKWAEQARQGRVSDAILSW